jgi:surface antigen
MTKTARFMIALAFACMFCAVVVQPAQAAGSVAAAPASTVPTGPIVDPPKVPNHFAFGYCTWYVATKRNIPWRGNAIDWWANAHAAGYAEGQAPVVGAIMVTRESVWGHVAYVESVNPDGSWTVSEMNYRAWDLVDKRIVRPGRTPVVGFIYAKA